jgi:bifunctional DNA-binding transcriptional regulator/antitoxin component of YhaV-PrlF toxin-antitoxin module
MSKVTKKLQVSVPKALADRYRIGPGDDLVWEAAGDVLRVIPPNRQISRSSRDGEERLQLFDEATRRTEARQKRRKLRPANARGWRRSDLYDRHGRTG